MASIVDLPEVNPDCTMHTLNKNRTVQNQSTSPLTGRLYYNSNRQKITRMKNQTKFYVMTK